MRLAIVSEAHPDLVLIRQMIEERNLSQPRRIQVATFSQPETSGGDVASFHPDFLLLRLDQCDEDRVHSLKRLEQIKSIRATIVCSRSIDEKTRFIYGNSARINVIDLEHEAHQLTHLLNRLMQNSGDSRPRIHTRRRISENIELITADGRRAEGQLTDRSQMGVQLTLCAAGLTKPLQPKDQLVLQSVKTGLPSAAKKFVASVVWQQSASGLTQRLLAQQTLGLRIIAML